jgi:hypothetical protein
VDRGIVVSVSQYIPQEKISSRPSLRVLVCSNHTAADIEELTTALRQVVGGAAPKSPAKLDSARKRKPARA